MLLGGVLPAVASGVPATQQTPQDGVDMEGVVAGFLRDFEAMLQDDPSVDGVQRRELVDFVASSLSEAGDASPAAVDKGAWREAIEGLQRSGGLDSADAADLTRRLDSALEPLERRSTQVALEFSRRLQEDGQEQALEWLRKQNAIEAASAAAKEGGAQPVPRNPGVSLDADAVNSRARRVRGPPKMSA